MRTAREVNDHKPRWVIKKIGQRVAALGQLGRKPKIALLGLAFKPNIDDLRESPAVFIAEQLIADSRFEVLVVEPNIHQLPVQLSQASLVSLQEAIAQADVIAELVQHQEFANLDVNQLSFVGE